MGLVVFRQLPSLSRPFVELPGPGLHPVLPLGLPLSWGSALSPALTLCPPWGPALLLCLQVFDDFIFVFFAMEMVLKMVALGIFGKKCYLGDTWNRLDFFIVMAG